MRPCKLHVAGSKPAVSTSQRGVMVTCLVANEALRVRFTASAPAAIVQRQGSPIVYRKARVRLPVVAPGLLVQWQNSTLATCRRAFDSLRVHICRDSSKGEHWLETPEVLVRVQLTAQLSMWCSGQHPPLSRERPGFNSRHGLTSGSVVQW